MLMEEHGVVQQRIALGSWTASTCRRPGQNPKIDQHSNSILAMPQRQSNTHPAHETVSLKVLNNEFDACVEEAFDEHNKVWTELKNCGGISDNRNWSECDDDFVKKKDNVCAPNYV